ncbi:MAG TPA: ParB N-terminal domain-containing protein [Thermoclostridium caenicola]|uniref:ParB-like nuclease domain-containing protein n=1 Tax=Thermoclostridium caenicola TaxID=659425 RepID=A0A1M6CHR4_9FIRM|nr:ParB N-terminal domain-containing protein [Thermoclostridium caenicola]SHI60562.1 ParB-like nuclease domain-containing protein [Thermoclostridium caenicola]HOK43036.1 ParB N-terminal domain-containing protein [Thermoclostridium caenicola]HOL84853.1 ParB N-terminal domain-containing protein [Thermoclostridium caenicola]HPO76991.1 ParB N-terminal domain-containing protein [Thermoclostridium caenicola]HPU22293.1 ParB N-terminal domain-containing protein [Thermoclostridium caenicola]
MYPFTLQGAMHFARMGLIEAWIHGFLNGPGHNKAFSDGLKLKRRYYVGPMLVELDKLNRCCGPEPGMIYRVDKDGFEGIVNGMIQALRNGWDMPPLIVNYAQGYCEVNDGNHRHEALKRIGVKAYYVIFWTTDPKDYQDLLLIQKGEKALA